MFIAFVPHDIALLRSAMFELNRGYKHFAPLEQSQSLTGRYRVTVLTRPNNDFRALRQSDKKEN